MKYTTVNHISYASNSVVYDMIDISKLFMSILVCGIHTLGDIGVLFPVFRITVPLFFTVSSYFFFSKLNQSENNCHKKVLKHFLKRNITLYGFWAAVLLPQILLQNNYFSNGIFSCLFIIISRLFFGSTFTGSWFLSSLIIGTVIVYCLSKKFKNIYLVVFSAILYIYCCLMSNYRNFFPEDGFLQKLLYLYPGTVYRSFPISLIFITIGKIFADGEISVRKPVALALSILSLVFLYTEYAIIQYFDCSVENDFYFMLVPTTVLIFSLLLSSNISIKYGVVMRNISTIIYCSHGAVKWVILHFLPNLSLGPILFISVISISTIIAICILVLENFRPLRWLKHSH